MPPSVASTRHGSAWFRAAAPHGHAVLRGSCVQSDDHSVRAAAPSAAAPSAAATSAPPQRPGETEAQPRAYPVGMVTTLPYGSWPSPISAELLATGGTRLGGPQLVGEDRKSVV